MNKIGLITWHYYLNFGSVLQAYALQTVLTNYGQVEIINYRNPKFKKFSTAKNWTKIAMGYILPNSNRIIKNSFNLFFYQHLKKVSKLFYDLDKWKNTYDCIICGSDQIWAPNVFDPVYMLNFCDSSNTKKISYAASIGLNDIPDDLISQYRKLLSDFHFISVREESGAQLLRGKCGIKEVTTVLDPTLLLNPSEYTKIEKKVKNPNNFIFCYFLNDNNEYERRVRVYAKQNDQSIVGWSAKEKDTSYLGNYKWIGPQEFLWLIHHAKCVFTDSYHGTIFSLLYHKPFYTFERFKSDDPINQNSRIYQLDKWFGISKRIVTDTHPIEACEEFDYDKFEIDLKKARRISINFLKEALS